MHSDRLGTCIKEIQGKYAKNYFGLRGLFTCGSGYIVSIAQMVPNWQRLSVEQCAFICK